MPIPALPPLDRTSPTFRADLDQYFLTAIPAFASAANTLATDVQADADAAAASATASSGSAVASATSASQSATQAANAALSAASAAATAGAAMWNASTDYALGACAWSPGDYQTYRRKVAGVSAGDPVTDQTHWERISGSAGGAAKSYYYGSM